MPYLGLLTLAALILALVDIAGADETQIRGLPRLQWLLVVVLVPLAGSIAWAIAGRPRNTGNRPRPAAPRDPAAEEEFLRRCRERAEEQRRSARQQREQHDDPDDS